ncbi:serine hydrolase domain-containing protein [Halorientalis pallida]|uniref:serine hydrolase domain-containing protein n=1 Tax=Halorientalis pallida TaxID=2479928 RepID=UPI003C6F3070
MPRLTDDDERRLRAVFDRHLSVGLHDGAQLAVYVDGDLAVDFAGGTDPDGQETTPTRRHVLFSCTKPYVGVALHRLVEDGALDYDDRVVDHWPEFAEAGSEKAAITVRHVLSHQSGIPFGEFDERPDLWGDWDEVVRAMEEIDPVFPPGERAAYHSLNYGWLVGELIRRVSGDPVAEFVETELFEPLGMTDTSIGLRDGEAPDSVATLSGFSVFDRCRDPAEGLGDPPAEAAAAFNDPAIRRAVVPAATGMGTARDMARFYATIANGGELDGTRILDAETVEDALAVQAETEDDGTLGRPMRYALGFWKGGHPADMFGTISDERLFGHAGLGSVFGWGDPDTGVGFAYVTNGIREESYEHAARVNAMTDAVRTVLRE